MATPLAVRKVDVLGVKLFLVKLPDRRPHGGSIDQGSCKRLLEQSETAKRKARPVGKEECGRRFSMAERGVVTKKRTRVGRQGQKRWRIGVEGSWPTFHDAYTMSGPVHPPPRPIDPFEPFEAEVTTLRTALRGAERQASNLEHTVAELRADNARLQRELAQRPATPAAPPPSSTALHRHIRKIVFHLHPDRNQRQLVDREELLKELTAAMNDA